MIDYQLLMYFFITDGMILKQSPNPIINNRIANHLVLVSNNSEAIQNVFPLNQHPNMMFSIFLIPDVYPTKIREIRIVGMANKRLIQPNPKNQAKSFIIHKGKCSDSMRDFSLYIKNTSLLILPPLSIFFRWDCKLVILKMYQ